MDSDLPLPELQEKNHVPSKGQIIYLRASASPLYNENTARPFHFWYGDSEKTQVAIAVALQNENYLLRFTQLADFAIDFTKSIVRYYPFPDIPQETIRHLILDQVIPRLIGHLGNLVLHSSAIILPSNSGVVFLGKSGWGKSTIASSFYQNGARLLTDDSLLLEEENGALLGIPAYPGSRLWQDSADTVFPGRSDLPNVAHFSNKKRLILHAHNVGALGVVVKAVFLLNDPLESSGESGIKIVGLKGAEAIMGLVKKAFLLDATDMGAVARQFVTASRIATTSPNVYYLSYPRKYHLLPEVQRRIVSIVNHERMEHISTFA